jgi:murein hydrolase activator
MLALRPLFVTVILLLMSGTSGAEGHDAARATENLDAVQLQLDTSQSHEKQLSVAVAAMLKEQEDLSAKLIAAADEVSLRQQALADTGSRITALDDEATTIRAELLAKRETLAEILAGLQRLEQNPPPALVVAPGRILDALRGAMMFGAVVPELRDQAARLANRLERLDSIKQETSKARDQAKSQFAALQQSQATIAALLDERKKTLAGQEKLLAEERTRMKELASRASNLKQLLAAIAQKEEQESAVAKALVLEEARQRELLDHPSVTLAKSRGRLEYPVQGRILAGYGDPNGMGGTLNGLAIAAAERVLVRCPVDAEVVFAGSFRSYGQLLILDAGEGYLLMMAGMKQIDVPLGQKLRAGEPVGAMGKSTAPGTSLFTGVTDGRAVLYVEIRKNGEPADSSEWWIGSRKEAMQ